TETEGDESENEGPSSESDESKDVGPSSRSEEAASEDQQQAVPVEGTAANKPKDLGYKAARRRVLELVEGFVPSTFVIGHSSRSVPEQRVADETSSFTSDYPNSYYSSRWDEFLEVRAQLELHGRILHDHTHSLDALLLALFEGYRRDFTRLFARSEAVHDEIHLQCFRLLSLERGQEEATIISGALWRPVLALEASARQTDA
ncbi:hypothetical protein Tco_1343303, partial [Tanacetum coccineum]